MISPHCAIVCVATLVPAGVLVAAVAAAVVEVPGLGGEGEVLARPGQPTLGGGQPPVGLGSRGVRGHQRRLPLGSCTMAWG